MTMYCNYNLQGNFLQTCQPNKSVLSTSINQSFNRHESINTIIILPNRFCAADRPLDYYIAWRFVNPKWSALKAMIASLAAGFFLVIPLFFEPRVETERYMKYDELNGTHIILVSRTPVFLWFLLPLQALDKLGSCVLSVQHYLFYKICQS